MPALIGVAVSAAAASLVAVSIQWQSVSLALVAGACAAMAIAYRDALFGSSEPYGGLEHVSLNADFDSEETLWNNMGYWESAERFSTAAEDLARKVGEAAGVTHGHRVLDLGFGCGDSLLLWLESRQLKSLTGVTSLKQQVEVAKRRVALVTPENPARGHIELHRGDAVKWLKKSTKEYDSIVAIDCVYHFRNRDDFFKQATQRLVSGGRIAVSDIILSNNVSTMDRNLHSALCLLLDVPQANLIDQNDYRRLIAKAGLTSMQFEDITDHVFEGLAKFIEKRSEESVAMSVIDQRVWSRYCKFARVLRWWKKKDVVRFVIVSAARP